MLYNFCTTTLKYNWNKSIAIIALEYFTVVIKSSQDYTHTYVYMWIDHQRRQIGVCNNH